MLGQLYPVCFGCHHAMRWAALEAVARPNKDLLCVSVYVCTECGRLDIYEFDRSAESQGWHLHLFDNAAGDDMVDLIYEPPPPRLSDGSVVPERLCAH